MTHGGWWDWAEEDQGVPRVNCFHAFSHDPTEVRDEGLVGQRSMVQREGSAEIVSAGGCYEFYYQQSSFIVNIKAKSVVGEG